MDGTKRSVRSATSSLLLLGLAAGTVQGGGHWTDSFHRCPRLPHGAMPAPRGFFVRSWQAAQTTGAEADKFVIYLMEWKPSSTVPGPYGEQHLAQIASRLTAVPFPVVLEPEPDEKLNEARRQAVIEVLADHGIADAAARVIVARPRAEPLYGDEAPSIYFQAVQGTRRGGIGGGSGQFGGVGGNGSGIGGAGSNLGGFGGGFRGY